MLNNAKQCYTTQKERANGTLFLCISFYVNYFFQLRWNATFKPRSKKPNLLI